MLNTLRLSAALWLFIAVIQLVACAYNLEEEYTFSASLDDGYKLHWNFDLEQQTIAFAVNVSSTGWVGFGLSPNGQMPQSDVVIGWVDNDGTANFHDRFADGRYLPDVDESQDWFLVNGEEQNGHTILEFTRNFKPCDPNDLPIKAETARVIWAYHSDDPVSITSLGRLQHERKGSISLNLLGGSNEDRNFNNTSSFTIANENVTLPDKETSYWCSIHKLPDEVANQEKHIVEFGPAISASSIQYVHHVLVYFCFEDVTDTHVGTSSECSTNSLFYRCRGNKLLAGWAVGGEAFVYPKDVAFPIGGEGNTQFFLLEIHYDNKNRTSGVSDSSGIKFTYTDEPQQHRAGVLLTGYDLYLDTIIIPPGSDNFKISGLCPGDYTNLFIPSEGITVFGNLLHTHLKGRGVAVRQYRQNDNCSGLEELQPIDENTNYDFDFQQFTRLPREVKIMPGDFIEVECSYRTTEDTNVTLGGESTQEEMCLSFLLYYPQVQASICWSYTPRSAYTEFVQQYIPQSLHEMFNSASDNQGLRSILDQVEWTEEASALLQNISSSTTSFGIPLPTTECPYEAPDICTIPTDLPATSVSPSSTSPSSASSVNTSVLHQLILVMCITLALAKTVVTS